MIRSLFPSRLCRFYFTILLSLPIFIQAQTTTLIDFGATSSENIYGLSGWEEPLLDDDMTHVAEGPGGVSLQSNLDIYSDFMGVAGNERLFSLGERIVVTWFNNSENTISFTSRISFTDSDNPSAESPDGHWYTMRSFEDYRITYQEIQPFESLKTVYNITDRGVHKTDSVYSLVNVSLSIEWFDSYMKRFLICDKIELFEDADISPPCTPDELTAVSVSHSDIRLEWNYPCDDLDPVEYLIYRDNEIEGYAREMNYTVYNLNHDTEYSFAVTALDDVGNESDKSESLVITTALFGGNNQLVNPAGFQYLGVIALPEDFAYGADALAYNPNGNDLSGSFFVTDINQPERGFVGEVTIPPPIISSAKNYEELNTAEIINSPVNIRPENVNNWEYVDVWITGLEYIEDEKRLYSSWAIYYDVIFDKTASISCVNALDINGGEKYGAWFMGSGNASVVPNDPYLNDYLFTVPQEWAIENLSGQSLINGRYREGGLSGLGPTLYSTSLAGSSDPPAAESESEITTLLQYGPVEESDNYNFPNSINDYNHADWWKGADWISVEDQSAVVIVGDKGLGHNYYGYNGEQMRHDWVIADVPYPEFWETDPDGKGWKAYNTQPMILFYDPAELANVASGTVEAYQPQPYAALRLNRDFFFGEAAQISSAAYDNYNNILYIAEFIPEMFGNIVIHAWGVNYIATNIKNEQSVPHEYSLEQNYPNPFNHSTKIKFSIPNSGGLNEYKNTRIIVYNMLGEKVKTLLNENLTQGNYEVSFDGGNIPSGIYFYRLIAGEFSKTKKMILLK